MSRKVVVLGWDCAAPKLVFERYRNKLPNVMRIMESGCSGKLKSIIPPITVPAWRSMVTGKTPGELGLWGFRHRMNYSYTDFTIPISSDLKRDAIWDIIGQYGQKSICSSIPPSYPPYKIEGILISDFLTPEGRNYTYPDTVNNEIEKVVGEYPLDAVFRIDNKEKIRQSVFEMTEKHFKVFETFLKNKEWRFSMHVEIGLDRIQHAFWRYFDENHHLHEKDSVYRDVVMDYYILLDGWLGRIMEFIDEDTLLIVASDHGAKAMEGAFCVNQWLAENGYLKFTESPKAGDNLNTAKINWKKTKAWGWGGYYARIFFNVKGREQEGIISVKKLPKEIKKMRNLIEKIKGPNNESWDNKSFIPDEIYKKCNGPKPDLMVFWDGLSWRSAETFNPENKYLRHNDTGPDDGVHDMEGIIMAWKKNWKTKYELTDVDLLDIFPTVLKYLGIDNIDKTEGKEIKELLYD